MNDKNTIPIAAVLGNNVAHSLSPSIHNYWLNKYKIKGFYIPVQVNDNKHLKEVVSSLPKIGCVGFNVTIPYKEEIMQYMDKISDVAKAIGSVNTVSYDSDNGFYGDNSDYIGFLNHFKSSFNMPLDNKKVVIIGAGGTTRAVIYALSKFNNVEISLVNRTIENAIKLKEEFSNTKITCIPLNALNDVLENSDAIINTSSMGMHNQNDIELNWNLVKKAKVLDVIYMPQQTNFIKSARMFGLDAENGLGMLVHQAVLGFNYWFKQSPSVEEDIYTHIQNILNQRN